jgi:putative FmdB family regulatory protein
MAIYEYHCKKCDKIEEVRKLMSEIDRTEKCEECGTKMKRQISRNTSWKFGVGYR